MITKNYDSSVTYSVDHVVKSETEAPKKFTSERKPLMIGCSGGGGHNSAIDGVRGFLGSLYNEKIIFTQYKPQLHQDKRQSATRKQIQTGIEAMHNPIVGGALRSVVSLTPFPVLPDKTKLDDEIKTLSTKEDNFNKDGGRYYIDMLLDVYPAGYESAAIWNVLQKNDETKELKKLISLQKESDAANYKAVYEYYFNLLNEAAGNQDPYTEIISTQAMSLPALCDAVKDYNSKRNPSHPEVIIHQYMTDLPTRGAVHFFNALSQLDSEQQKQMKLYGVEMEDKVINYFFPLPDGQNFAGLYSIPANENPMVRPGFKRADLDNSKDFDQDTTISLKDPKGAPMSVAVAAHEQIASIMLGSQASNDTVEYIETLLKSGVDRVFVFGGTNPNISKKIKELESNPKYANRIVALGNQNDLQIAPLMSRSNLVVIRGGGLSVMEQMAMNHNPQQTVLVHHANSPEVELTSGISWEDENVEKLIQYLRAKNVHAEKTSPERAMQQIPEARLIAALKKENNNHITESQMELIKSMSSSEVMVFNKLLIQLEQGQVKNSFSSFMDVFNNIPKNSEMSKKWCTALHMTLKEGTLEKHKELFFNPEAHQNFFYQSFLQVVCTKLAKKIEEFQKSEPSKYVNVIIPAVGSLYGAIEARDIKKLQQAFKEIVPKLNSSNLGVLGDLCENLMEQVAIDSDIPQLERNLSNVGLMSLVEVQASLPQLEQKPSQKDEESLEVNYNLDPALDEFYNKFSKYVDELRKAKKSSFGVFFGPVLLFMIL